MSALRPRRPARVTGRPTTTPTASYSATIVASSARSESRRLSRASVTTGTASTPARVTAGDADPHRPDIDAEPDPHAPYAGRRTRTQRPARSARTAANASSILAGSPPAPCARSALPPPRAPSTGAKHLHQVAGVEPAVLPDRSLTAATKAAAPSSVGEASSDDRRAGLGRSRPRTSRASVRRSLPLTPAGAWPRRRRLAPTDLLARAASAPALASTCADAQPLQLLLGALSRSSDAVDPLGQLLRLGLELTGELVDEHVLAGQEAERVEPDQRLDPAHPGADRRLAQQLDHADHRAAFGTWVPPQSSRE